MTAQCLTVSVLGSVHSLLRSLLCVSAPTMKLLILVALVAAATGAQGQRVGTLGKPPQPLFQRPQFGNGMILQRGTGTLVFGYNAAAPIHLKIVFNNNTETSAISNAPDAANNGRWIATLPEIDAAHTSTVTATDGINIDILNDVAWGDVLLCGGTYWLISQSDNQVSYHTQLSKEENPRGSPPVIRLRSRIALHLNPSPLYQ